MRTSLLLLASTATLISACTPNAAPSAPTAAPTTTAAGPRVVRLFAGGHSTCAADDRGALRCWGADIFGAGGTGFIRKPTLPVAVDLGEPVEEMAMSVAHACAVTKSGRVRCFGEAQDGKLGGTAAQFAPASAATTVDVGGRATHVTVGVQHSCASTDRGVRCWGTGKGNVDPGGAVAELAASWTSTCTRLGDGAVRCWGEGYDAPFTTIDVGAPAQQLVVGLRHGCALLGSGNVRCWGASSFGELGYGSRDAAFGKGEPAKRGDVDVGGKVTQLAIGSNHTCALLESKKLRCWGSNGKGQLGYAKSDDIGDDERPSAAGDVDVGGDVVQVVAGIQHTCALLADGRVRCWGANDQLQLGRAGETKKPVDVL